MLETYSQYLTKFSSPMACYVHDAVMLNGDDGDDYWSDSNWGEGAARYGRRVLSWDSDGCVDLDKYDTEEEAVTAIRADQCWRELHAWGDVEHARVTGTLHRKCAWCGAITLDLTDDE